MHTCMTKVISISDEAYELLSKLKKDNSFSKVIIEMVWEKRYKDIMKLAGAWSNEDAEKVKKMIYEDKKLPSRRFS